MWVALYLAGACVLTVIGLLLGRNNDVQEDLDHLEKVQAATVNA